MTDRRTNRMPDYAAIGPLRAVLVNMALDQGDPRDVLLAASYRLAARLERGVSPWDAQGHGLIGARHFVHLPAGRFSVHLEAQVGRFEELHREVWR